MFGGPLIVAAFLSAIAIIGLLLPCLFCLMFHLITLRRLKGAVAAFRKSFKSDPSFVFNS
jgi:hypothetical protein